MNESYGANERYIDTMYAVIGNLARKRLPIVFKGALVLNYILKQHDVATTVARATEDIDSTWISDGDIDMQELLAVVEEAVENTSISGLSVRIDRTFAKGRTAGFSVYHESDPNHAIFSMDIGVADSFVGSTTYHLPDGTTFNGSSLERIFVDKLTVLSSPRIFRRAKDLLDLYLLSDLDCFDTTNILPILQQIEKPLGDFETFLTEIDALKHAYDKLSGVVDKPEFKIVYARVRDFCQPFITPSRLGNNIRWVPRDGRWYEY